jgi:hypothetical protein
MGEAVLKLDAGSENAAAQWMIRFAPAAGAKRRALF